jgi:RND family efflux transporter MFP subunit
MQSLEVVRNLEACRSFSGPVKAFWALFAQTCGRLAHGCHAQVMVQRSGQWIVVARWPETGGEPAEQLRAAETFAPLAQAALAQGVITAAASGPAGLSLIVLALETGEAADGCTLAVTLPLERAQALAETADLLRLAADTPLLYQRQRQLERTKRDIVYFSQALEVLTALNVHTRFLAVAMALTNEVATRFQATRVVLGWLEEPYIRAQAVSGADRFEKMMEAVQRLEAAMEEARDQDEEIVYPPPPDLHQVTRDHEAYAKSEGSDHLVSVPIRVDGEVRGVLTLERATPAFTEDEVAGLRVLADQVARRLDELRRNDRWFGARWALWWREYFSHWLGPRHTWSKVAAVAGVLLAAVVFLVPVPFRVEAPFLMRSDALAHLPAPFDGYLAEVLVRPGDPVTSGQTLARLDDSDLLIEESAAKAELQRFASEAEQAEANRQLADMRVALAMKAQAQARLDLCRYRLARAVIRAPYDGVLVEGDLRERIGAPVRTGEVLMKVTQLAGLYVEMQVAERDIDQVLASRTAEVAFASRPEETFAVEVTRIEPSAVPDRNGNSFIVRGRLTGNAGWFRPGMSGIAKINAGRRNLAWIGTHRLVDFLRLKLWW